jgi:hypothetical protein
VTRNSRYSRLTVEELATDCIDVRDLNKAGALKGGWVTFPWIGFRCPGIRKMRTARYLVLIELHNQVVPQQIPVSWTPCNYGGTRPWLHCLCGRRVARLFKGFGGYHCRQCCGNAIYESQRRNEKAAVVSAIISSPTTAWRVASGNRSGTGTSLSHEGKDLRPAM